MTHEQLPGLEGTPEQAETADIVADIQAARAKAELARKGTSQIAAHLVLNRTLVEQGILNPVHTPEEEIAS